MTTASVIISSYNYAAFLPAAIESALAQAHPRTEVIVVDDGSPDDSPRVIRGFGDRVRAILKPNAGQASALNAGFAASSGDVVVFLDSDDLLDPCAVADVVAAMDASVSKMHWPLRQVDGCGRTLPNLVPGDELPHGNLREIVLRHGPRSDEYIWPPTSGNAFSRAFLRQVLPMPETPYRTCPDLYLCGLAPLYGNVTNSPAPLGAWRVHDENCTWKQPFRPRVRSYVKLWEDCCADVARHAARLGLEHDRDRWIAESWWHRLDRCADWLVQSTPRDAKIILIDDEQWGCRELDGRSVCPLLSGGGAPADDGHAVRELELRISEGAKYLVVAACASWWLDHYTGLAGHLGERFDRARADDDLVVYNLRDRRS